ncbi:B12-binding domain-containing radical SAM protein [Bacillus taeanensis]|uniref:B12-binding domain-containing radical SAM protein n=1 Tax=Bacillus taeanensis TaxID=273032 RepID=A0A366Y0K9_9BACI|nr:B12-binding domain-containing radical SAM protein [Bacillus taeanensis]RBW70895.1 B12-binding domain-containing radical SAM protein [Bacillus taeanensis]
MNVVISTLNAKYIHTCLALRYLKAYAAPEYEVEMTEYTIKDPIMNIVSDLYSKKPDVIGFSCYIWNIEETIPIIKMLKKINPELMVMLGGPEVTYDTEYWMERIPEVDFIVKGEGEGIFKELLLQIEGEKDYQSIGNLAFRDNGKTVITPPSKKINLNDIPSPFRFEEDSQNLGKRITYIETSRGCPFSCQFCLSSIEVGVRYFDVARMKDELIFLMDHGAKTIKFVDRTFNIKRDYALDMFQFLIDNHRPGCVFQFEITADIMRPEVLDFLNENAPAGLFRFEIGVQSTNDTTNELVMRKQNFNKLTRTVMMVKEGGKIDQHLDLIAGLPEEDYNSFRKTFNDVFKMRPEELQLGFLKMLRGTGLRMRAEDHNYIYMDHSPYEILGNNVLSFDDIVRIKQVEDVLEKYWNDHRMDHTINYLVEHVFSSPFDFFQEFGTYWDQQGWVRIGHQLEDLFRRLYQFLENFGIKHLHVVKSLMKFDYLLNQKIKPRKVWWNEAIEKTAKSQYLKRFLETPSLLGETFNNLQLTEKELFKHTVIEVLSFDLANYMNTKEVVANETLLLLYFDPKTHQVEYWIVPLTDLNIHSA